jgi:hypothetical protein
MRPYAIRLLMLTIAATAMVVVPVVTATEGEASSRHLRKHHQRHHFGLNHGLHDSWASGQFRPAAQPSYSGEVCPGNARAFDCKIWPPPMYDDPDRKISGSDGGG